ncbi:hypothetical protein JKF63_06828 [Porcisia hertigi]|uniref:Integral membrane transport protein n=1 Tax=Porcisia hertigi TaxID=2761500 RepID=A0A836LJ74_9TRYP|nr:hypothetical protein JKF63_06828 [Porcisia hertigi]
MQKEHQGSGTRMCATYAKLFKAHVLDVHVPNVLVGISSSIEVPLVVILGRRIGASFSAIADYVTVAPMCRVLLDIPFGIVIEYVGVQNVMIFCLLLNVIASVIGLSVSNSASLFIFCVLSGSSLGGFFLARHIFVAGITSKKYRGLLMAILAGLLRWSHVIGPVASGLFAVHSGDIRYSFVLSAASSGMALMSLSFAMWSTRQKQVCEQSCPTSAVSSVDATPLCSAQGGDPLNVVQHYPVGAVRDNVCAGTLLLPQATASSMTRIGGTLNGSDTAHHGVIVGAETSVIVPPPHIEGFHNGYAKDDVRTQSGRSCEVHTCAKAKQGHYFHLETLWGTLVDYWSVIWRLGMYHVLLTALRGNRKLLITFAGMRASMTDAQVSYLLGFSFIFDAILFPLGGLVMDQCGRQFAMIPVAVGLGTVYMFLPLCTTKQQLLMVSSAFGIVDALGCGLIMTLTADRAPLRYGAPYFGVMRMVQDIGHAAGARGVSSLIHYAGFNVCCWILAAIGFFTAAWGFYGVPRETDTLPKTSRLDQAASVAREGCLCKLSFGSRGSEETALLKTASLSTTTPTMTYGTVALPPPLG